MKDKKVKLSKDNKIILFLLMAYLVVMLILFLPGYISKMHDKIYIITSNYQIQYVRGKWYKIVPDKGSLDKDFQVYEDDNFKGVYNVFYSNSRINIFDKDDKRVPHQGKIFAYYSNVPMTVYNVSNNVEISETDKGIIDNALSTLNITGFKQASLFQKVELDIDKDGNSDAVYSVSNFYSYEDTATKTFSIIFIYKNNKIEIIKSSISDEILDSNVPSYNIQKVLDIKNDKKYELLYTQEYYAHPEKECVIISELKEKGKEIHNFCE